MTASTPCDHDKRFTGVFLLPKGTNGCLACAYEKAVSDLASAQEARQRAEEQVLSRIIGIATVGNIDGHEVIRRQSAIDVVRMVFAAIDAAREGK